jgi:hypothetical protein
MHTYTFHITHYKFPKDAHPQHSIIYDVVLVYSDANKIEYA